MSRLCLFLLPTLLCGQLRITASILSPTDIHTLFGPLHRQYGAARVDICSSSPDSVSVPSARIRQQLKLTNGIVVLSDIEALTLISRAQSNTKAARTLRYGLIAVELTALGAAWSRLGAGVKDTINASAASGAGVLSIIQNSTVAQMVSYSAQSAPATLQIAPMGCTPTYIQLIETIPNERAIDFVMPL